MPTNTLPEKPSKHVIREILSPGWDPSQVRGFDITIDDLDNSAALIDGTSIRNVGAIYPSLIVSESQPGTSGGETTYDFLTDDGPGQNRTGSVLATARAEAGQDYVGDSGSYSSADAETIVEEIATHVEDICFETAGGGSSAFSFVGCQRPSDAPIDDATGEGEVVWLAQVEIRFGHIRGPQ